MEIFTLDKLILTMETKSIESKQSTLESTLNKELFLKHLKIFKFPQIAIQLCWVK